MVFTVKQWLNNDELAIDIWEKKYRFMDETFDQWLDRVSGSDSKVRKLIFDKKFIFGGRILANRGLQHTGKGVTYSNCYVLTPPEDNLESIFEAGSKMARVFSYGGGVGLDLSKLCPAGSRVNNAAEISSGAISFMEFYSLITALISQKGRRGALLLSLDINHPDVIKFIEMKSEPGQIEKANISVRVDDSFMVKVMNELIHTTKYIRKETEQEIISEIPAKELLEKISYQAWNMAEPGLLFWDKIKNWSLLSNYEDFEFSGTNPCVIGDTLIETSEGRIPIKDLVGKTPFVYTIGSTGKLEMKLATKIWRTRTEAEVVKVKTYKGQLICTPDHLILTNKRGWVQAKDLVRGEKIVGFNRTVKSTHVFVGFGKYREKEHRFVAGSFYEIFGKDVHHKDNNVFNNRLSNLEVLEHAVHSRISNIGHSQFCERCQTTGKFLPGTGSGKNRRKGGFGKKVGCNWIVESVIPLVEKYDVYDMTVQDNHNFIANEFVVHNCGEQPLPSGGACNLGAINLSEFVINAFTPYARVDENELAKTVNIAIIALNDCLDEGLGLHPLQEQRESVEKWRQVGLGVMGFADMLIKMGVEYGSDRCCEVIDFVGKTILWQAVRTSAKLAKTRGSYPGFNAGRVVNTDFAQANFSDDLMGCIIQEGLCNSQLLTIAPTGTISTMFGVSGGMEPLFDTAYLRKTESLHGEDHYYRVKTPIAIIADSHGITEDKLAVAHKISPADRIKVQAAWQRWIDASISSTINLPATATVEDVFDIYKNAWESGLKGVTVYREGCARGAILSKVEPQAQLAGTVVRETNDNVLGLKRRLTTGCGSLWCTAFFDRDSAELVEVFLSKGSTGGCNNFMVSLSRMLSLAARAGVEVEQIVDQLHSCGTCPSYAVRRALNKDASKGSCCPAAVGYALMDMSAEMRANSTDKAVKITSPDVAEGMKCPQCKTPMSMVEGCVMCRSCGFSRCS